MKHTHPAIRSLRKAQSGPSLHGTQVWRSSYLLMGYLAAHPIDSSQQVMELGCGWGLLGIYCAKHFGADVLLVDADAQVFPYAERHADLNGVRVKTEQATFDMIPDRRLREHDLLLGADICFWPELTTQLRRLFERAIAHDVERILLADPGRSTFFRLAEDCQRRYGARIIPLRTSRRAGTGGHLLVIDRTRMHG